LQYVRKLKKYVYNIELRCCIIIYVGRTTIIYYLYIIINRNGIEVFRLFQSLKGHHTMFVFVFSGSVCRKRIRVNISRDKPPIFVNNIQTVLAKYAGKRRGC